MTPSQGTGVVTEILEAAPGCYELTFVPQAALKAAPGQFLQVSVTEGWDPLLRRPLSIYDLQEKGTRCKLLFRVWGRGTKLLRNFHVGRALDYIGPLGNGFTIFPDSPRELLIAGGIGVAPLHYLARVLEQAGKKVDFILGAPTEQQLLALPSLKAMGVEVEVATDDGSAGYKGTATKLLACYLQQNSLPDRLYCCGPQPMIEQVIYIAAKHNLPVQASHEERMACGIGVCMGCAFHHPEDGTSPDDYQYYRRLCIDGPVISYHYRR